MNLKGLSQSNVKKTRDVVVRGKSKKPVPDEIPNIGGKVGSKLLGVVFNEDPHNWDTQIDLLLNIASSRLYILRVCKLNGYSRDKLTILYNSLIMVLFSYAVEAWGAAFNARQHRRIDKFNILAFNKYRFSGSLSTMSDLIYCRDRKLWDTIVSDPRHVLYDLVPQQRQRGGLRDRGHNFILPSVCTERFKNAFL